MSEILEYGQVPRRKLVQGLAHGHALFKSVLGAGDTFRVEHVACVCELSYPGQHAVVQVQLAVTRLRRLGVLRGHDDGGAAVGLAFTRSRSRPARRARLHA